MVRGRRVRTGGVVACARPTGDCCSPNAKRKDQKDLVVDKLPHTLSPSSKIQTITRFFQAVHEEEPQEGDDQNPLVFEDLTSAVINREDDDDESRLLEVHTTVSIRAALSKILSTKVADDDDDDDEDDELSIPLRNEISVAAVRPTYAEAAASPAPLGGQQPVRGTTPHRIELRLGGASALDEFNQLPSYDRPCSRNRKELHQQPARMALTPKRIQPPTRTRKKLNHNNAATGVAANKSTAKTSQNTANSNNNHVITEFFPVRRSVRKTKKTVLEEKQRTVEELIRSHTEDGLRIQNFEGKGRGVVAARDFVKGDFVVEYSGELIDMGEARRREVRYAQDQNTGCYMYYFKHKSQQYCIDATAETGRLGRLVNHSRNGNLTTQIVSVDELPRLVLIAREAVDCGEEVTYDYGDRSKESLVHHPWLAY